MSTLIVTLPLSFTGAVPEYDYVLTSDGLNIASHGRTPAALLPVPSKPGAEVVAMVPARALSWHQVKLPETIGKSVLTRRSDQPRLRAVLVGLMEEHLLEEPDQLHFAVFPGKQPDQPVWVAVCNRAWLVDAVQALDTAGRAVSRIVPEFAPAMGDASPNTAHVITGQVSAQLVLCTPMGVTSLPLCAAAASMAARADKVEVLAEPAVATLAEQVLKRQVNLQTVAQRSLQAFSTPWNLAQFDMAPSSRTRMQKSLSGGWLTLSRAPQWRPMRWGLVVLLLTHVLGLNAWAWKERNLLDEKRAAVRSLFLQTFPETQVVVDAPAQMERAVADLQQATGQASGTGLADTLMSLAASAPDYQPLTAIEFTAEEIRLKGPQVSAQASAAIVRKLGAQGQPARVEGDRLVIQRGGHP